MLEYYCNHCDTKFKVEINESQDVVCPRCGVGVVTEGGFLTHPVNKSMSVDKAKEIISWLGWRGFKQAQSGYANDHPELRPKRR